MIRCFLAISLPSEMEDFLSSSRAIWQGIRGRIRWVSVKNCHVTLKFLGDVDESLIEPMAAALNATVSSFAPFTLSLSRAGVFPNKARPRVLWLGIGGQVRELGRLQREIDNSLQRLGFEREKRSFVPHVTVARVKGLSSPGDLDTFLKTSVPRMSFQVNEVNLMKSVLTQDGPIYSRIKAFSLTGPGKPVNF